MAEVELQLSKVQEKLQVLLKQFQQLQKDNEVLRQQLATKKKEEDEWKEKATQLQQKLEIVSAASPAFKPEEKAAFEKRINEYVKEIDKCIEQLLKMA